jgi:hypothetical protein
MQREICATLESLRLALAEARGESDYLFVEFSQLTGVGMGLGERTCNLIILLGEQRSAALESDIRETLSELGLPVKSDTVDLQGMLRLVYDIPRWEWTTSGLMLYLVESCFGLSGCRTLKFYLDKIEMGEM